VKIETSVQQDPTLVLARHRAHRYKVHHSFLIATTREMR